MPRGFRTAVQETREAYDDRFFRDKKYRSFIGFKPDKPEELHEILYGVDVEPRRREVFIRDGYKCKRCGRDVAWDSEDALLERPIGHLRHIVGGSVDRCWCLHNLEVSCAECHKPDHVHTRFGEHK